MTRPLLLSAALAVGASLLASTAIAQPYDVRHYDGYCYAKKKEAQRDGAIIGAIIGGIIGSNVAARHHRDSGTVAGAIIGGKVGSEAGKNSVKCYNGEYYAYQGSYYEPDPAPPGYTTLYFETRPDRDAYDHVYYDRYHHDYPAPWRYGDAWRDDGNNPNGWRDDRGNWHDGRRPHDQRRHDGRSPH